SKGGARGQHCGPTNSRRSCPHLVRALNLSPSEVRRLSSVSRSFESHTTLTSNCCEHHTPRLQKLQKLKARKETSRQRGPVSRGLDQPRKILWSCEVIANRLCTEPGWL